MAHGDGLHGPGERDVTRLIAAMTLEEKLSFVHGALDPESRGQAGYIPGVPRLGIPPLRLVDGPAGIHVREQATALPAPIMLASAFDDDLAYAFGAVLGSEARAHGQHVVLSPMVNLIRTPYGGRNFETFSEDVIHSARLGVRQIQGIQSQDVMANVKHLAMNNQERDRQTLDVRIEDAVLRETELVPFEAAVAAGVATVMGAYNKINGTYSCEHPQLLTRILREEWGFDGWVMSDWRATHSTGAIVAGLDQEMPLGVFFAERLQEAIESGEIPVSVLDQSVSRILTQMARFELLGEDRPERIASSTPASAEVAQKVAEQGAVLLWNPAGVLPLDESIRRVAVIGRPAITPVIGGAGSSQVHAGDISIPLDELRRRAPKTEFVFEAGLDFQPEPIADHLISPSLPSGGISLGYAATHTTEATLTVEQSGFHQFVVRAAQSISLLTIDGIDVLRGARNGDARGGIHLTEGEHSFTLALTAIRSTDLVTVEWVRPDGQETALSAAVTAAASADLAILFAFDAATEGWDRPGLALPFGQDALIDAVSRAAKNSILVLHTGSGITMPWLEQVDAVLEMYFPGQVGGRAVTRLLYGDVSPSGKLTQTFPASESETPVAGNTFSYPGVNNVLVHTEGADIGYRWYQVTETEPLFPFGHGLSYTTFAIENGEWAHDGASVSVDVTNTGSRAGTEIVQAYVQTTKSTLNGVPPRVLTGYARVPLEPGETRRVKITLDPRVLRSWDPRSSSWGADYTIAALYVGSSSVDLPVVIPADR